MPDLPLAHPVALGLGYQRAFNPSDPRFSDAPQRALRPIMRWRLEAGQALGCLPRSCDVGN